jgi:hypothetical protein
MAQAGNTRSFLLTGLSRFPIVHHIRYPWLQRVIGIWKNKNNTIQYVYILKFIIIEYF